MMLLPPGALHAVSSSVACVDSPLVSLYNLENAYLLLAFHENSPEKRERRLILRDPTPKKTAVFFNERFMPARHEEACHEKHISRKYLVYKGLPNDEVGEARGTIFRETRPGGLVSTPAISSKKSWEGYRRTGQRRVFTRAKTTLVHFKKWQER